jgi:hypothetical protein
MTDLLSKLETARPTPETLASHLPSVALDRITAKVTRASGQTPRPFIVVAALSQQSLPPLPGWPSFLG